MIKQATLQDLKLELTIRQRPNNIVWTTKSGKVISIKDMSFTHLINTIRMLEKIKQEEEDRISKELERIEYENEIEELQDRLFDEEYEALSSIGDVDFNY